MEDYQLIAVGIGIGMILALLIFIVSLGIAVVVSDLRKEKRDKPSGYGRQP